MSAEVKPNEIETNLSRSLVEQVISKLRQEITTGKMAPGTRLRIDNLARRFAVSSIPVREALRVLESEGLLHITAQKGAIVADASLEDMLEIYKLRVDLEGQATRQACLRRESGWLEAVRVAFERLDKVSQFSEEADKPQLTDETEAAHANFHLCIYSGCGSKWLLRFVTTLYYTSERYRRLAIPMRGSIYDILNEHRQIYKALCDGEAEIAARYMQNHIDRTAILLTQLYTEGENKNLAFQDSETAL